MKKHSQQFSIGKMAKVLGVSRSGYYKFCNKKESARTRENNKLIEKIKKIHLESHQIYGSPRIHAELKSQGEICSRKRVAALMRKEKIYAKMYKRKKITTVASKKTEYIAPNLLKQKFETNAPNKIWASDITYIATEEGWLYLSVVLDLFSRKIVGLNMDARLQAAIVVKAVNQALIHREICKENNLIHHSDRGVQYTSEAFHEITKQNNIILSMSAKGYCYDNAVVESFFHTLKSEHIAFYRYRTREEARVSVFEYIQSFYNRKRRHSTLGYLSPEEFEELYMEKQKERVLAV